MLAQNIYYMKIYDMVNLIMVVGLGHNLVLFVIYIYSKLRSVDFWMINFLGQSTSPISIEIDQIRHNKSSTNQTARFLVA